MTALRLDATEVVRLGDETYRVRRESREAAAEVGLQLGVRAEPLRSSLAPNAWRSGLTACVKGTLD